MRQGTKEEPPFARRGRTAMLIYPQLVVVLAMLALWWWGYARVGRLLWVAPPAAVVCSRVLMSARRASVVKAVRSAGGRLCTMCGYQLTGLPEHGRCPECASAYDMGQTIRAWADFGLSTPNR